MSFAPNLKALRVEKREPKLVDGKPDALELLAIVRV